MADYISREDVLKIIRVHCNKCDCTTNCGDVCDIPNLYSSFLKLDHYSIPAADVTDLQHGTWLLEEYHLYWDSPDQRLRCSICGYCHEYDEWFEFCPGCGNPMGGKGEDNGT